MTQRQLHGNKHWDPKITGAVSHCFGEFASEEFSSASCFVPQSCFHFTKDRNITIQQSCEAKSQTHKGLICKANCSGKPQQAQWVKSFNLSCPFTNPRTRPTKRISQKQRGDRKKGTHTRQANRRADKRIWPTALVSTLRRRLSTALSSIFHVCRVHTFKC